MPLSPGQSADRPTEDPEPETINCTVSGLPPEVPVITSASTFDPGILPDVTLSAATPFTTVPVPVALPVQTLGLSPVPVTAVELLVIVTGPKAREPELF